MLFIHLATVERTNCTMTYRLWEKRACLAVIIISVLFYSEISAQSHTNFWVKRIEMCQVNGSVAFYGRVTTEGSKQYFHMNLTSSIPLDANIGMILDIETSFNNKTFMPLFTVREKDFCKAFNKYLGEFWYDIERAAQVPPGVCPIREGRYRVNHVYMDFRKMTLQTFPFGTLRLIFKANDRRNSRIHFCVIFEVYNPPQ